jgi:hypothetical protein
VLLLLLLLLLTVVLVLVLVLRLTLFRSHSITVAGDVAPPPLALPRSLAL